MNQENCKNCTTSFTGNYCPNCGQKVIAVPLSIANLTNYIKGLFDFDSGFFYTFWILFRKPETLINDFLAGKSKPYKNPVQFILTIIALVYFLEVIFRWYEARVTGNPFILNDVTDQLELTFNLFNLFLFIFTVLYNYLLFKSRFTFTEHVVIACYQLAMYYILGTVVVQLFYYGVFEGTYGQLLLGTVILFILPIPLVRFSLRVFSGKLVIILIKVIAFYACVLSASILWSRISS
ncbi:MAG: DUF3667 domain-containing protein [Cyclobacteriaceae bacterium]|nr:DUF3667 domain-containing protein [Cyclobacteriaceae bacterium]